jgi:hypothetical protein
MIWIRNALQIMAAGLVTAFAIGLIILKLLNADWNGKPVHDWLSEMKPEAEAEQTIPAEAGVVQNYVLFTTHNYQRFKVVTGTQFVSTARQDIDHQWCYISTPNSDGKMSSRLTLANMNSAGTLSIPDFSKTALAQFDLSASQARALVKSHCRFQ